MLPRLFSPFSSSIEASIPSQSDIEVIYAIHRKIDKPPVPLQQWNDSFIKPQLERRDAQIAEAIRLKAQEAAQRAEDAKRLQYQQAAEIAVKTPPQASVVPSPSGSIQEIIIKWANHYGANADQLLRVARCESGFNLNAHNPSGATGLFQFMPGTFSGNAARIGLANPNIYSAEDQAQVAAYMFSIGQSGQWVCK